MDLNQTARKRWQSLTSRVRAATYRLLGMRIEGRCWLQAIEWPLRPRCISLGDCAALDGGITLLATNDDARIVIGPRTYLNRHTMIDASELVEIGADAMLGPGCYITDHDHAASAGATPGSQPLVSAPTRIGARCWLGAHVVVLKGVTIGEGTVVGAGSVVTKSLPARVVAVGNPARVIRSLEIQQNGRLE
jgi:acetyltransferase-like isoleucine patch superfamily enzyme